MLIDDVKTANRVKTMDAGIVGELQDLIDTAKADLILAGVLESKIDNMEINNDSLLKRAVIFYTKANFGLDNPDSEKYQKAYDSLKTHLCLSQEYTIEVV